METLYTAVGTLLGRTKTVTSESAPFTSREVGIADQNVPALLRMGVLKEVKETAPTLPDEERVEEAVAEEEKSKVAGGVWTFTKDELKDKTLPELLSCIESLCEQYEIAPPKVKTIRGAIQFLSKDLR